MKGRRIYPTDSSLFPSEACPGDYWIVPSHGWFAACPVLPDDDEMLLFAVLCKHNVVEQEDGTITVSPSILVGGNYPDSPAE